MKRFKVSSMRLWRMAAMAVRGWTPAAERWVPKVWRRAWMSTTRPRSSVLGILALQWASKMLIVGGFSNNLASKGGYPRSARHSRTPLPAFGPSPFSLRSKPICSPARV